MKRKLTIIIALLSILSLSACIQRTESPSVTKVRSAKAEELKSLAALEKAQAAAELTIANAEAALKAAQAKLQVAAAEKAKAEAEAAKLEAELTAVQAQAQEQMNEAQRIENERQQALLEAALEKAEVAKANALKQIAEIQAQIELNAIIYQRDFANAQKQLQQALHELNSQIESLSNQGIDINDIELSRLYKQYKQYSALYADALREYANAKDGLNAYKIRLISASEDLIDAQEAKQIAIEENEKEIARLKVQIEAYKKYDNYTEDLESLRAAYDVLEPERNVINNTIYLKDQQYKEAKNALDFSEIDSLDEEIRESDFWRFAMNGQVRSEVEFEGVEHNQTFYFSYYLNLRPANYSYNSNIFKFYLSEEDLTPYITDSYSLGNLLEVELFEPNVDTRINEIWLNKDIESYTGWYELSLRSFKEKKAAYDGTPFTYVYDSENKVWKEEPITDAVNAVNTTKKAKEEYDAIKVKEDATEAEILAKKQAYEDAVNAENTLLSDIEICKQSVASFMANLEADKVALDMILHYNEYCTALSEKVDLRNDKLIELTSSLYELFEEKCMLQVRLDELQSEYYALDYILYGNRYNSSGSIIDSNYDVSANHIQSAIEDLESKIADLIAENENISSIETKEALVDNFTRQVEAQEAKVKLLEQYLQECKANLDAVIAELNALIEEAEDSAEEE